MVRWDFKELISKLLNVYNSGSKREVVAKSWEVLNIFFVCNKSFSRAGQLKTYGSSP